MVTPSKHIEFIRLVSTGTNLMDAYKLTNGNSKVTEGAAKTGGSKLAKKYAKEITEAKQKHKDIAEQANINAIVKTSEMRIISAARRMEILSDIAEGLIPLTKPMVVDGAIELIPVVPDWMDRKQAISELNKMCGDYAPIKQEIKTESNAQTITINRDGDTISLKIKDELPT